jgi:hypothetical protein
MQIIVHVAAVDHHHVGTITIDRSTPLLKTVVAAIDPTATGRTGVLAPGPSTRRDAHPIVRVSRTANAAATLTSPMSQEHDHVSRIVSAVTTPMNRTRQQHDHASGMMFPHAVAVHNSMIGSNGTPNNAMVTIAIVRNVDQLMMHAVHTALSSRSASPTIDSNMTHSLCAGLIVPWHATMTPPVHEIANSLRGITSISAMILHIAQGTQKDTHHAVSESPM